MPYEGANVPSAGEMASRNCEERTLWQLGRKDLSHEITRPRGGERRAEKKGGKRNALMDQSAQYWGRGKMAGLGRTGGPKGISRGVE